MIYPIEWNSEKQIHNLFSYQTRIGMAHKFGKIPIGWYQNHQCNAYDVIVEALLARGIKKARVRVSQGSMYAYPINPKSKRIMLFPDIDIIFRTADTRTRTS